MKYVIVKLNGTDVSAYKREYVKDSRVSSDALIDQIDIKFKADCTPAPAIGQTLEVYSGYTNPPTVRTFYGMVKQVTTTKQDYQVKGFSELVKASDTIVNVVYNVGDATLGVISAIWYDLMTAYAGLSASVVTTPDTIQKFKCANTDVLERGVTLAQLVDYDITYDHDSRIAYFRPRAYTSNASIIYVGGANNNTVQIPQWKDEGLQDLCNKVTIYGATTFVSNTKNYTGDGGTTAFLVDHIPDTVTVTVSGVEKVGGLAGATTTYDYSVDRENKAINFVSAPAGAAAIVIKYFYNVPVPVVNLDSASIALYGTIHKIFTFTDLTTVEDAIKRSQRVLNNFAHPFKSATILLSPSDIPTINPKVGQMIRVVDAINGIDDFFVIKQVKEYYPEKHRELLVSDKEWKWQSTDASSQLRIKRLEEQFNEGNNVVSNVITGGANLSTKRFILQTLSVRINDSFILGHSTNGVLGRGTILDDFEGTYANWAGTSCTVSEQTDV